MKTTIELKSLKSAFSRISGVVDAKASLPALAYAKLVVENGKTKLTGSNLSSSITTSLDIVESDSGATLIPFETLTKWFASLSDDSKLKFETTGETGTVTSGKNTHLKFTTTGLAGFPENETRPTVGSQFNLHTLNELLARAEIAAPVASGKFSIPVVQLESIEGKLTAVATDGHRIAVAELQAGLDKKILLPRDAVALLKNLESSKDQLVSFYESENNLFFETAESTLLIRKSTAQFPQWQKAFAQVVGILTFTVSVEELSDAIKRVQAVLNSKAPGVLFENRGDNDDDVLLVSYKNSETNGETYDVVAAKMTQVGPAKGIDTVRFRLNANYVADFLDRAKDSVTITFAGDTKPVLFTNDGFKYLIMPITG